MAGLNQRLRGHLYNQVMNKDLSTLDETRYLAIAKEQQDPSEKEFFEFLEKQKPEMKLRGSKTDFVVCVKSIQARIVICDKASTGFTDFDSEDISVDLTVKLNSFELK